MLPLSTRLKIIALGLILSAGLWAGMLWLKPILPDQVRRGIDYVDLFLYDLFFPLTSSNHPPSSLIVIDSQDQLDDRSRSDYADMVERLLAADAKVVAFDIVFAEGKDSAGTAQLAASSAGRHNVIHAFRLIYHASNGAANHPPGGIEKFSLPLPADFDASRIPPANTVMASFQTLLDSTASAGHITYRQIDLRYMPFWLVYEGRLYPTLALEIARRYLGVDEQNMVVEQDLISLRTETQVYEIPTDDNGLALIHFIPEQEFTRKLTWNAALAQLENPGDHFAEALVLIVNSSSVDDPYVVVPTLDNVSYPPWAFHASMISQILNQNHVEESPFHNLWITLALVLLALAWLLFGEYRLPQRWRKPGLVLLALAGVLFLVAYLAMLNGQRMWIVVPAALVINSTYLATRRLMDILVKTVAYADFEILVAESRHGTYPVAVTASPAGGEAGSAFRSFLDDPKFQETMRRLKMLAAQRPDFLWLGAKLFGSIFSNKIHLLYEQSLSLLEAQKQYLRLKLRIDAPELAVLPWELLYDERYRRTFLALSKNISIVRHTPTPGHFDKTPIQLPLKILVVDSNPVDLPSLKTKEEKNDLKTALWQLILARDAKLMITEKPTLAEIERLLHEGVHILHFIGHGKFDADSGQGALALEDETGQSDWIEAQRFGELLRGSGVQLAVLNSCETATAADGDAFLGVAPNLIAAGVPAVVAMQFEVPDEVAIVFARAFYPAFLANHSIDAAVTTARRKIMALPKPLNQHWATPVLFMRSSDGVVFG
jgi:CHASE2 domain-containing sensor protein